MPEITDFRDFQGAEIWQHFKQNVTNFRDVESARE